MKKILIPVDGSAYSKKAVEHGKMIARAFNSDVVLLNVLQVNFPLVTAGPFGQNAEYVTKLYDEAKKASEAFLQESAKEFEGIAENVETVSLHGEAADAIVDYVDKNDVDLIIMGSHGMGAIMNRLFTGSVTTKVLHHVGKPVLVVK